MIVTCIMPSGERLQLERWIFDNWRHGNLSDPYLLQILEGAQRIEANGYEGRITVYP